MTALLAPVVQTAIPTAPADNNTPSGSESREARMPPVITSPSPVTAEGQPIKPDNQGPAPALPQTMAATESADLSRPAVTLSGAEPPILNTPGTERSHSATAPVPASPVTTSATISTTVGQPGWGQELGLQLAQWQQRGEHRVELHLHPAELGPLSVSLKVDDQGAQAQFFSAHGQVRQALEQALPQLREALAQQGINLGRQALAISNRDNSNRPISRKRNPVPPPASCWPMPKTSKPPALRFAPYRSVREWICTLEIPDASAH